MITIHPQYLTLSKLLDGRLFCIPEYQRAYSWTSSERQDLFGDIEKVRDKGQDAGHFMAAVVCLRREKQTLGTDEFHVLEIVDGQQRLTTLIILLNTIKLALNRKDKAVAKLARELTESARQGRGRRVAPAPDQSRQQPLLCELSSERHCLQHRHWPRRWPTARFFGRSRIARRSPQSGRPAVNRCPL